jgi:HSP20 family molecular chaperone IbpA
MEDMRYVVRNTGQDMSRLMDAVFGDTEQLTARTPAADVWEEDTRYVMELELPGLNRDSIDVRVEVNLLTIATRKSETGNGDESQSESRKYVLRERRRGDFVRSFSLPKDVDTNAIEARAHDGILTLTIGKAEQAQPRSIEIKSE